MEDLAPLLLLRSPAWISGRIRALVSRLFTVSPSHLQELLGSICENPSSKITNSRGQRDEVWVCADGRHICIGDMAPEHVAHCLALILHTAREGYSWTMREDGMMVRKKRKEVEWIANARLS